MRKKMVAGNWKMHGSRSKARVLLDAIRQGGLGDEAVDVIVFPSFVYLALAEKMLKGTGVQWGAQNMYVEQAGAFTGEVAGSMLVDYGCQWVLVGHSERRQLFHETVDMVAAKFKAALECGLQPILCVGETLEEREKAETWNVLRQQLVSVIEHAGVDAFQKAVLAYEPVWAIGTGLTATPLQAQEAHEFLRKEVANYDPTIANQLRVLYGGSVKADNAQGLFAMPDIDGALVGGASLDAASFLSICQAASWTEQK